jgi:peptidoglycan/xylan/chitin deacetylase (PgdA/CDA1 family)
MSSWPTILPLPGYSLVRRLTSPMARMLLYHRFGPPHSHRRLRPDAFERQLQYIRRHYAPTRLDTLSGRLRNGEPIGTRAVVVTIDDGYRDFYEYAYPLLEKYEVPATLFVVSQFVEGQIWLWPDAVHYVLHAASPGRYLLTIGRHKIPVSLTDRTSRDHAWGPVADTLLPMKAAERQRHLHVLQTALDVTLPERPTSTYQPLGWQEIRSMDRQLVECGSHSATHPILSICSDDELLEEIAGSKRLIERRLSCAVSSFAYPNGQPDDYDARCIAGLANSGYESAVIATGGLIGRDADVYTLPRMAVHDDHRQFRSALDGWKSIRDSASEQFHSRIAATRVKVLG